MLGDEGYAWRISGESSSHMAKVAEGEGARQARACPLTGGVSKPVSSGISRVSPVRTTSSESRTRSSCQAGQAVLTVAAALFTVSTSANYLLILFNPGTHNWIHWATFALPLLSLLIVIATVTADLITRNNLLTAPDLERVDTNAAFWLSVLALVSTIAWAGLIQYIRWFALQKAPKQRRREVEETKGWDWWSLWPWADDACCVICADTVLQDYEVAVDVDSVRPASGPIGQFKVSSVVMPRRSARQGKSHPRPRPMTRSQLSFGP